MSAAGRPHALVIAWAFPPSRSSGVYRALATVNALARGGFDVTVLTCEREAFVRYTGVDEGLESRVDPAVEIVRIPFAWPQNDPDLRRWPRARARRPLAWRDRRNAEDVADFPEVIYGPWCADVVAAARAVHRRRPVDLCVATANPNADVEAAHQLHRTHGVPYVLDQRDGWTLHTFDETRTTDARVIERETAHVAGALECWYVNEPIRAWHAEQYPEHADRMKVVSNGYDPEFAPAPRLAPAPADRPVVFGYVGTVTRAVAVGEFVDGWLAASTADPLMRDARAELYGYLGFSAVPDAELATELRRAEDAGVSYRGPLAKQDVGPRYAEFDVLLLLLGNGRFVTSGKVFEYMASGLPIVSVHATDLDATTVLRDYPLWFPAARLDGPSVAAALTAAAHAARTADATTREACVAYAARWERSHQVEPRVRALLAHVRQAGAEVKR